MGLFKIHSLLLTICILLAPFSSGANPEKAKKSAPREVVVGPRPVAAVVKVVQSAPEKPAVKKAPEAVKKAPEAVKKAPKEVAQEAKKPDAKKAPQDAKKAPQEDTEETKKPAVEVDEAEERVRVAAEELIARAEQSAISAASPSPEDPVIEPAEGQEAEAEAEAEAAQETPGGAVQPEEMAASAQTARLEQLSSMVDRELDYIRAANAKVSLVAAHLEGEPIISWDPDIPRVPASNAKLLTSTAAARTLPGKHRFLTQVSRGRKGGPLYIWGTGDPVLTGRDIMALARRVKKAGVGVVRGVVVDDSYLDRRRLAPGFSSFADGSRYRPTSGAVNVDSNAVVVKVSAPKGRMHPRVDVFPPSDYVRVRKLVRFTRARKGKRAKDSTIRISRSQKGSIMWLTVSGKMGRKAPTRTIRLAVYDPGLNAAWALRRALRKQGVLVLGTVRRGRRPTKGKVLATREHSLSAVLGRTNRNSDNLAAENLVRAMGRMGGKKAAGDTWKAGLALLTKTLGELGISGFTQGNGSGLHRSSRITARTMVTLLRKIYSDKKLRTRLLPTLAVAGDSGTLTRRMRGTAAEGYLKGKTGTLGNALALSGYVVGEGVEKPLVFSMLINGTASRAVKARIDNIAELLARFARGLPLRDEVALAR